MEDHHQLNNENLGLYCYFLEDSPSEWSLWREADDTQLTPWLDLGPQGGIWVECDDGDELLLVLERRDDEAVPAVLEQALMHLPSGRQTDFIFAGDRSWDTFYGIRACHNVGNRAMLVLTFPRDHLDRTDVLGGSLYDRQLRDLVGPCIAHIGFCMRHPFLPLLIRRADPSIAEGVRIATGIFDYESARFLVPAEYEDVFEYQSLWVCNRKDACDLRDEQGQIIATYAYTLKERDDDSLYVERGGLWGIADAKGRIRVEPYAESLEALSAEPKEFQKLVLKADIAAPLCLDAPTLAALINAIGGLDICIKYEGIQREDGGDGMLDASCARMPGGESAIFLEDRWGDQKFLVLVDSWRNLPAGAVLALKGKSRVITLMQGGEEDNFLSAVLEQAVDFGYL